MQGPLGAVPSTVPSSGSCRSLRCDTMPGATSHGEPGSFPSSRPSWECSSNARDDTASPLSVPFPPFPFLSARAFCASSAPASASASASAFASHINPLPDPPATSHAGAPPACRAASTGTLPLSPGSIQPALRPAALTACLRPRFVPGHPSVPSTSLAI